MPSSDETYYNLKRLHVVFAVSSLALLAVTVWMLAADHWREWKVHQRTFRDRVEPWLTEARIRQAEAEQSAAERKELEAALAKARAAVPDEAWIRRFCEEVQRGALGRGAERADVAGIEVAYGALARRPSVEARQKLLDRLSEHVAAAGNDQESVERQLRFRRAEFAEARSFYEAAVGEGRSQAELERLQQRVDRARQQVDQLVTRAEEASAHGEALTRILGEITRPEDDARGALAEHRASVARLERLWAEQRPNFGKRLLRLPLIDALGRPLAIDQIWLPELTIDYSFRQVARFDRCMTCHQGIAQSLPGRPSEPACLAEHVLTVQLAAAEAASESRGPDAEDPVERLRHEYGLMFAESGILEPDAATVGLVVPRSLAADAGLRIGDLVEQINGVRVANRHAATEILLDQPRPSEPFTLAIRRGLPHPYGSHPRLDLMVGSLSPHPVSEFGCTICHDGQGSATEFKFASHTPNDPQERVRWRKEYGWFWNPHWDFPMRPARFAESGCLKCHHEVTDLAPSRRFPDPPAPKLLAGYHLVRQNGCFGCHEIRGVTATGERVGPDMRLEPNYHEAGLELLADPDLTDRQRTLALQVVQHPEDPELRRQLAASLRARAAEGDGSGSDEGLKPASAAAVDWLDAVDSAPGTMRKVGSSLRDMAGKLDAVFLDEWLRDPAAFRPDTRMPQFYSMHEHLDGKSLNDARRFEAAEIYAVSDYLLAVSQPVEPLAPPAEVTEPPSPERGKRLFLTQGCLACHKHEDFPEGQGTIGPNLSGLGTKLNTEAGGRWLVSWILDPARHAPRTRMPNVLLEPIPLTETDAEGGGAAGAGTDGLDPAAKGPSGGPRMTDPAADVAAYLLDSASAAQGPVIRRPLVEAELDELVLLHLSQALSGKRAAEYLAGRLELTAEQSRGDTIELLGQVTRQKKIRYLGRRTIRKRGCYGCHDVPGFQDAQLIGPALSDWGRKQPSLLAFEQIHQYIAQESARRQGASGAGGNTNTNANANADADADPDAGAGADPDADPDRDFYVEAVLAHRREGFIWQKLRAPRSFDYKKTENKGYHERLTMGRFTLTPEEREAIITFVLGLVAEPPAQQYVYQGDRRRTAIVEGGKVLDKYGCAECHTLEMARWQIQYDPDQVEAPYPADDFAFLEPRIDTEKLEASARPDPRGLLHAEAVGMPQRDESGAPLEDFDDDDNSMYYLNLWEPLAVKAEGDWGIWPVGGAQIGVSDPLRIAAGPPDPTAPSATFAVQPTVRPTYTPHLTATRAPVGGAFARLLFPHVLDEQNPAVMEAWGWVPPPLVDEGRKVQPAWLHDYLLEPLRIRPASVLRMPKYTMSPDEAGKLVDYFAAAAGVDFPYSSDPRSRSAGLEAKERHRPNRLDDAMRIVIDRTTFCTKCHLIGDFSPGGEIRTVLAPRLDRVAGRIRPDYLRRWLANPKTRLPYTAMPVNFPPIGPPIGQDLYQGSSLEQLEAVSDLLVNYDWYIRGRTSMRAMILSAEEAAAGGSPEGERPR